MRRGWLAAAVIVIVSACGGDDGDRGGGGVDAPGGTTAHRFCVDETNRYRAMNGKPDVAYSVQLETYANTGAMVDHNGSPHQHFSSTQGGGIAFAENECPRWSLQQQGGGDMIMLVGACIAAFYAEGPGTGNAHGHYNNMMGDYGTLGCGIYQAGTSVTIIQDFGR
jgi:hypothetical protein